MREYPPEWPDTDGFVEQLPTVYVHIVDSAWPPANDDMDTPTGWAVCSSWEIECELDAPLLPGQINAAAKFVTAKASCTIPQPAGGMLAPWRAGGEKLPSSGHAELVASHDGPTGATAFLLGRFLLDPIKGKLSDPYLTLTLIQDTLRLRKNHTMPPSISGGTFTAEFSPTQLLEHAAAVNNFTLSSTADFPSRVVSSYFSATTEELNAMQEIVAANLGVMFLAMDGATIQVKDADYLLGTGDVVDVLDVSKDFDDLSWSQDLGAAVDRVEVTYQPPVLTGSPHPTYTTSVGLWTAARGTRILAGGTLRVTFDPGMPAYWAPLTTVPVANAAPDGTGTILFMSMTITPLTSGAVRLTIANPNGVPAYLVTDDNRPWTISPARQDISSTSTQQTLAWGVSAAASTNTLTFNLGRNIQRTEDAQDILDRIVARVTASTYVLESVRVPLDFRRELADLYRAEASEVEFDSRLLVTGLKLTGSSGEIVQTLSAAALGA